MPVMLPEVRVTPATLSLHVPRSSTTPPLTLIDAAELMALVSTRASVPADQVVVPCTCSRPESVTVPAVVLFRPTEPPADRADRPGLHGEGERELVRTPVVPVMLPEVRVTPATLSLYVPMPSVGTVDVDRRGRVDGVGRARASVPARVSHRAGTRVEAEKAQAEVVAVPIGRRS